jgi:hypothetical protein
MATTYISRTLGTPTSSTTWTFSAWIKKSAPTGEMCLLNGKQSPTNEQLIKFDNTGAFCSYNYVGSVMTSNKISTALFRDPSAWMHVVFIWDTTNGTAEDRNRMYINGNRITSFSTNTNAGSSIASKINAAYPHYIGSAGGSSMFVNGSMSHVYLVDGLALEPTVFAEADSTSGMWKIKTSPTIASYGNNGFCLKMEDASNLDLDSSSNAHTFTTSGTLTATKDNPSNNFCTMSPVISSSYPILSGGNNTVTGGSSNNGNTAASMAVQAGKWYAEVEFDAINGDYPGVGMWQLSHSAYGRCVNGGNNNEPGDDPAGFEYNPEGEVKVNTSWSAFGSAVSAGDIVQIALDCDNGAAYVGVEGVWQGSGDPTSGASKTGAAVTWTPADKPQGVAFGENCYNGSVTKYNFGNGYFGTTAVTSTNADDAGIGSFEFDVPTGYYALCTKNIKAYGG